MIIGFVDDGIGRELTDLSIWDRRGCPITLCRISDSRQCQMSEVDNETIMVFDVRELVVRPRPRSDSPIGGA